MCEFAIAMFQVTSYYSGPFLKFFHTQFIKPMTHRLISWISEIGCPRLTLETV